MGISLFGKSVCILVLLLVWVYAVSSIKRGDSMSESGLKTDYKELRFYYSDLILMESDCKEYNHVHTKRDGTAYIAGQTPEELKEKMGVLIHSMFKENDGERKELDE
jgi:hypothetical protein